MLSRTDDELIVILGDGRTFQADGVFQRLLRAIAQAARRGLVALIGRAEWESLGRGRRSGPQSSRYVTMRLYLIFY